ncbi:MAG: NADPH oxidase activator 1 [Sclerophora amabilis]|nr:MAG: NADPH oxidase activator 1 [Sclerophora amabilis]
MNDNISLRFATKHLPEPPNAPPPTHIPLSPSSANSLFSHAILLFHAYDWEESIKAHRSLIRRNTIGLIPPSRLWFNIGAVRCHLGEYALAAEAFDKSVKEDPDMAVGWFCYGVALYQLEDFRRAERAFKMILAYFEDGLTEIDYRPIGLDFILPKVRVQFNVRQSMLWKLHKQVNAPRPQDWTLNRMPAGLIFEPVELSRRSMDLGGSSPPATPPEPLIDHSSHLPRHDSVSKLGQRVRNVLKRTSHSEKGSSPSETHSLGSQKQAATSIFKPSSLVRALHDQFSTSRSTFSSSTSDDQQQQQGRAATSVGSNDDRDNPLAVPRFMSPPDYPIPRYVQLSDLAALDVPRSAAIPINPGSQSSNVVRQYQHEARYSPDPRHPPPDPRSRSRQRTANNIIFPPRSDSLRRNDFLSRNNLFTFPRNHSPAPPTSPPAAPPNPTSTTATYAKKQLYVPASGHQESALSRGLRENGVGLNQRQQRRQRQQQQQPIIRDSFDIIGLSGASPGGGVIIAEEEEEEEEEEEKEEGHHRAHRAPPQQER